MGLKFNPFTGKLDFTGSAGGGSPTGAAGGDLAGTYPNPTVDGLQGRPVSNATPYNGQVLQYDGSNWVPGSIPSGGSGGGGVVYFLNFSTAADAPVTNIPQTPNASKELGITAETTATSYQSAILSTASYDFLASFVTDLNVPSTPAIPAGLWDFNIFAESTTTNSANQVYYKIEILKYDGVNAPTLLATSNDTYIYDPTEITQYVSSVVMPQTTILATDRIVVYLYGRAHQNNNRLTFHFGSTYPSHTHSTMPSVTGTGVVKVVNGVFQNPATTIVNADVSASAAIAQSKIANLTTDLAAKVGGSVGAVDNAVPRADGTGGFTVQGSGLIVEDAIESFTSITGDAGTDVITATGSAFANGQPVRFTSLTGGTGLNTTTNYFVREVSGATFKVETSIGGGAINFTTNITAGTLLTGHSVSTNVTLSENTTATNSDLVLTPKGTGAFILGPKPDGTAVGGNARSVNCVDLQTSRSQATQVASGVSSIVAGRFNTASGQGCVAIGETCSATNQWAVAVGSNTASSGLGSVSINGFNSASANYSLSSGVNTLANRYAMQAHSAGNFAGQGDAQRARFVLRCKTTTNSAVEMALDGGTTYLSIPSGKVIACTINISGVKSDGSAVAHYVRQYAVKNVGGTSSEVYAPVTIGTDNAAGTVIALSANDADDTLRISVTGTASTIWRWVASVDAVEIAYGT